MKKIKMLVFSILFTVLYSAQAQAANYYSLTGDKNFVLNAFDKYFNPSTTGIIGTFLDFYMPICLVVAGIIATYILIVGTVTTAHEGEMLGKKWSSLWVPIRAPLAVSLLLPVSNGWAVIQLIVMALAVQGTEWGDAGWKKIAPSLITDSTYISVTNKTAIRQLVVNTLYSAACVKINNDVATKALQKSGVKLYGFMDAANFKSDSGSNKMIGYTFGYPDGNAFSGYKADKCGSTKMKLLNEDKMPDPGSLLINTNGIAMNVQKAQIAANAALVSGAMAYAEANLKDRSKTIDVETLNKHIDLMTNAYAQIVQTAAEAAMKDAVNQSQVDKLTEAGWTYSYAFYMRITTAASSANAALNNFPISSATLKEEDFKYNTWGEVYSRLDKVRTLLNATNKLNSNLSDEGNNDGLYQKAIGIIGGNLGVFGTQKADTASLMPLTVSANIGEHVIYGVDAMLAALTVGSMLGSLPVIGGGIQAVVGLLSGTLTSFFVPLLIVGNMLAHVMPMMPYIIGFGCVIGYIVLVLEAICGAPLLVVASITPDQDGVVGKQGQGYMLLLSLLLRPALNVAGYAASFVAMNISFEYINSTFFAAASDVEGGFLGIQKGITMIVIYCVLTLSATLACCKLMHLLPDTIFKWIGGASSTVLGMLSTHAESGMLKAQAAVGASMQYATAGQGSMINKAGKFGQSLGDKIIPQPKNTATNGDNGEGSGESEEKSESSNNKPKDTSVDLQDFNK